MGGKVTTTLALTLVMTALWASPVAAETANVCGTLSQYRAPTQTQPGSITVGSETFAITTDARSNISPQATVGSQVCLTGTWNMSQTVGRVLTEFTVGPRVASAAPSSAAASPQALPSTRTDPGTPDPVNYGVLAIAALAVLGAAFAAVRLRRS